MMKLNCENNDMKFYSKDNLEIWLKVFEWGVSLYIVMFIVGKVI